MYFSPFHYLFYFRFLKSTIGKDLTRVTMPVYFNEPLSFLQVSFDYFLRAKLIFVLQMGSICIDTLTFVYKNAEKA